MPSRVRDSGDGLRTARFSASAPDGVIGQSVPDNGDNQERLP
jgi:hypothetical protein